MRKPLFGNSKKIFFDTPYLRSDADAVRNIFADAYAVRNIFVDVNAVNIFLLLTLTPSIYFVDCYYNPVTKYFLLCGGD